MGHYSVGIEHILAMDPSNCTVKIVTANQRFFCAVTVDPKDSVENVKLKIQVVVGVDLNG